jgi:hypothetical protein
MFICPEVPILITLSAEYVTQRGIHAAGDLVRKVVCFASVARRCTPPRRFRSASIVSVGVMAIRRFQSPP